MAIMPHTTPASYALPGIRWAPRLYPGEAAEAARVRSELRTDLARLPGLPAELVDAMALCASEAFANATAHTRSGEQGGRVVRALSFRGPGRLRFTLIDDGAATAPRVPHQRTDEEWDGAEDGRGLLLIDSLAAAWGTFAVVPFPFCAGLGTAVWAEFPLSSVGDRCGLGRSVHTG
ncbi:anti-sigma regulatory factor (Ser/Thr protein kinase) [Murinocardiopsis flavida]|uniref:Anti-sigma regulatory factor (Ser/Thr protein kinase) n=1 Tax=Murinocardiopsis flavida TaxID=645275 RepID=A0A2P8CSV0_9ACTN|nr:ATP-binding protein [Murinocardiopsis flavida]PSK88046.1 anti-sigma regulatory factor (Ser/Thr protein kinase) [Murinocardiopsis flavida]